MQVQERPTKTAATSGHTSNLVRLFIAAALLVILLAPAAEARCMRANAYYDGAPSPIMDVFAKTSTGSGDPILVVGDASAGSGTPQNVGRPGVMDAPSTARGGRAGGVEFKTPEPLASPFFLDLTLPITASIWVSSISQANTGASAITRVRVELYSGETFLGADLGAITYATMRRIDACFRPEARLLEAGKPLSLIVSMEHGPGDLYIHTNAPYQSFVRLRGFDRDPLRAGTFVEDHRLFLAPPEEPEPGSGDEGQTNTFALLGLAVIPLIAAPKGARRGALLTLMLVAAAVAGCASPGDTTNVDQHKAAHEEPGRFSQTIRDDPNATSKATGILKGVVRNLDKGSQPIPGADVSILRTSLFTKTDSAGAFGFDDLDPGQFVLRVSATGFPAREYNITIVAGKTTVVDLRLTATKGEGDAKPHDHGGVWDADRETFFETNVAVPLCPADPGSAETPCETLVIIPLGRVVKPGAIELEARMDWDTSPLTAPQTLGLRIVSPANTSTYQAFAPRAKGVPIHIPFFPHEADHGHARFTLWSFWIQTPPRGLPTPLAPALFTETTVKLRVEMVRGVAPEEPAHPDYWGGASNLTILQRAASLGSLTCKYPYPTSVGNGNYCGHYRPPAGKLVPPGTTRITGTLEWEKHADNAVTTVTESIPATWEIYYRPAVAPPDVWYPELLKKPAQSTSGKKLTFSFDVTEDETDQFYQLRSGWHFYVDDGRQEDVPGPSNGYRFLLTVEAFR
jgi:hypothetical protein